MQRATLAMVASLALSSLAGCAMQALNQENERFAVARGECSRQFPDELKRPIVPGLRCRQQASRAHFTSLARLGQENDLDLVELVLTRILMAAEKYDAGQLTEGQYLAERAQAIADAASQRQVRLNGRQVANAATMQARAAQQQASAVDQASRQRASDDDVFASMRPPTTTDCVTNGNNTRCQTKNSIWSR